MSDDRARSFRQGVEALSASQRRALADALAAAGDMGTSGRLVGFLALDRTNDGSPAPTDEALRAFLGERLPDYMIPSRFVLVDRLPRTAAGKLDRRALGRVEGTDLANDAGVRRSVAPRNAVASAALTVAAAAVSGAMLLLLEFYDPFDGLIRISSDPMVAAISRIPR